MKKIITKEEFAKILQGIKALDDFVVFDDAAFHGELPAIHESTRMRWRALEADPIKFQEFKEKEVDYVLNRSRTDYVAVSEIERRVKANLEYCKNFPDLSLLARREVIVVG